MKRLKSIIIFALGVALCHPAEGQTLDNLFTRNDSLNSFSLDNFYQIILKNHPVVSQANLLNEIAKQELRYARGNFDPKLVANADHKQFDDKVYYTKVDAALSLPTWFPVNPKVGYQNHSGALLNAEEGIPGQEQIYAGVSIPIGKGLITDERRIAVRQAEQMKSMAEADRVKIINKILFDAAKDYWHWFFSFYQFKLIEQNVTLSKQILERTLLNARQGEAAGIDTIQAGINLQSRLVELQEASLTRLNAELQLSNYLWSDEKEPVLLQSSMPAMTQLDSADIGDAMVDSLVSVATANHPELASIAAKINQAELEKSLAREMLKPQLDLNYYALSQPTASRTFDLKNDYKWGVDFSIPVFLRKERSKLALADAKITSARLQKLQSQREIINRIRMQFNQYQNSKKIITQQRAITDLYEKLVSAELTNLENGESDLFKINVQQEKLIQAQVKLLKSHSELQKEKVALFWAAGNIATPKP